MSRIIRHCPKCDADMPPDWKKPYCKFCGAMVNVEFKSERRDPGSYWDGREDLSDWRRKDYTPRRKITGMPDIEAIRPAPEIEISIRAVEPIFVLLMSVVTLGMSSTLWIKKKVDLADALSRPTDRTDPSRVWLWALMHLASILLLGAVPLEVMGVMPKTGIHQLSLIYFAVSFVIGRCYLMHVRAALIHTSSTSALRDKTREPFAPSPLAIWYLGPAYLQSHINSALASGVLSEERLRRRASELDSNRDRGE